MIALTMLALAFSHPTVSGATTAARGAIITPPISPPPPPPSPAPVTFTNKACHCMQTWNYDGVLFNACDILAPKSKRMWCITDSKCGFSMMSAGSHTDVASARWDFCDNPKMPSSQLAEVLSEVLPSHAAAPRHLDLLAVFAGAGLAAAVVVAVLTRALRRPTRTGESTGVELP